MCESCLFRFESCRKPFISWRKTEAPESDLSLDSSAHLVFLFPFLYTDSEKMMKRVIALIPKTLLGWIESGQEMLFLMWNSKFHLSPDRFPKFREFLTKSLAQRPTSIAGEKNKGQMNNQSIFHPLSNHN